MMKTMMIAFLVLSGCVDATMVVDDESGELVGLVGEMSEVDLGECGVAVAVTIGGEPTYAVDDNDVAKLKTSTGDAVDATYSKCKDFKILTSVSTISSVEM